MEAPNLKPSIRVGQTVGEAVTYRVTLMSALGLYVTGAALAVLLIAASLVSRSPRAVLLIAGVGFLAWLLAIRVRYFVRVSGEELETCNLFGRSSVKWKEIVRVAPAVEAGYWPGRLFGPAVIEFISARARVRVNFKLFPVECLHNVMLHVPPSAEG